MCHALAAMRELVPHTLRIRNVARVQRQLYKGGKPWKEGGVLVGSCSIDKIYAHNLLQIRWRCCCITLKTNHNDKRVDVAPSPPPPPPSATPPPAAACVANFCVRS